MARRVVSVGTVLLALAALTPGGAFNASSEERSVKPVRSQPDESIQPVYPLEVKPVHSAEKLCAALYDLPARRTGACCNRPPGISLASECVRMLSFAIRSGAVRLGDKDVAACAADFEKAFAGCDWVGSTPPDLPSSCSGIIHGTLASGSVCRSTLECGEGLRCFGVGPTTTGVCGKPKRDGSPCGKVEDPLLFYARQQGVDTERQECAGFCDRNRCREALALGAACSRNDACGAGRRCAGGLCVEGRIAKEGEACLGSVCQPGYRCREGVCSRPKEAGEICQADIDCLGGCEKAGDGVTGRCAKRCR